MSKPLMTEVLPSSGEHGPCVHDWQVAEKGEVQEGVQCILLACRKCGKTAVSRPYIVKESKDERPLLVE